MALLTSHVADRYVLRDLGFEKGTKFAAEHAKAYLAWDAIRAIGNGLKHATVQVVSAEQFDSEDMFFEHRDWWDGKAYGAPFGERMVPVDASCFGFIQEFSSDLMTGRVRERLPELRRAR